MIIPDDSYIIDLNTSCNIEHAVARLLGWIKSPITSTTPKIIGLEILENEIPLLDFMSKSLSMQLVILRNLARRELRKATKEGSSPATLEKKEEAFSYTVTLMKDSFKYKTDIDEELMRGEGSALKIDVGASEKYGDTHITLKSLDRWAREKYSISILDGNEPPSSPENVQAQTTLQVKEEDPNPKDGFTSIKATNVLSTFGFLVEAFAKTSPRFGGEKPNVSNIAKHIADLAVKAGGQGTMENQSYEAIRKRIKQAIDTKNSYLKKR